MTYMEKYIVMKFYTFRPEKFPIKSILNVFSVYWFHYCSRMSQSRYMSLDDLAISFMLQHRLYLAQQPFLDDLHKIHLVTNDGLD